MEKNVDVVSLGELLIDFTVNGVTQQNNQLFEANPGGAPCNVLAILNKLGKKTSFIGKVGKDQFGQLLKKTVESISIGTENLIMDEKVNTTLAFVHTMPDGDRDFSFYRDPGADMMLREDEIKEDLIKAAKIFHYGTISMTHEGIRGTTRKAIEIARKNACILSFDPNLRPPLWKSQAEAKTQILYGMSRCDIMKISDDEIQFVSGKEDIEEGISIIRQQFPNIKLVLATLGKEGSIAYLGEKCVKVPGFPRENTVDATGAGDTFCGSILNYVLEKGLDNLTKEQLKEMLTFANAAAALVTTKKGALCSMPEKAEILDLINA